MADTSIHIVDNVIAAIPVRQYVLTLPYALREWAARDHRVLTLMNRELNHAIFAWLKKRARKEGIDDGKPGSITFYQRFSDGLRTAPHIHLLVSDGVFYERANGKRRFHATNVPRQEDIEVIVERIAKRAVIALDKLRDRPSEHKDEALAIQQPLHLGDTPRERKKSAGVPKKLCASAEGFNLHAATRIAARDRSGLERICRYVSRPAIPEERLQLIDEDERVKLTLKRPWGDTTALVFEPLEFISHLVTLIPRPYDNLTVYNGIWAGNANGRDEVLPKQKKCRKGNRRTRRLRWSELLSRTFGIDGLRCGVCEGRLMVIAVITKPEPLEALCACLHLPAVQHLRARARAPPIDDCDWNDGPPADA